MLIKKNFLFLFICAFFNFFIAKAKINKLPKLAINNSEIIKFVNELRIFDENKAKLSQIKLNFQGHTSHKNLEDNAKKKLFEKVDETLFLLPTYTKFIALHNNYHFDTCKLENNTQQEDKEIDDFIAAIMQTKVFQHFKNFLQKHKHSIAISETTLRNGIKQLWFDQYSRACGVKDTSAFEHIFLGENKNNEISGLHDWIRLYLIEKNSTLNKFDYKGFIVKRAKIFAAIKYSLENVYKLFGSFLIGTSPEFNMALYTFCFLTKRGHKSTCNFEIDGCPISITSFEIYQNNNVYIGSIYPTAGKITEKCKLLNAKQH